MNRFCKHLLCLLAGILTAVGAGAQLAMSESPAPLFTSMQPVQEGHSEARQPYPIRNYDALQQELLAERRQNEQLLWLIGVLALILAGYLPVHSRRRLHQTAAGITVETDRQRTTLLQPGPLALTSADDRFLREVSDLVERHLSDERFNVEDLARRIGLSRSQLHRKLSLLTGQPPVEYIRMFRLQRAMDMLRAGAGNVSETGYAVGFNSPAYFARAFKDAFGISPSAVRRASCA